MAKRAKESSAGAAQSAPIQEATAPVEDTARTAESGHASEELKTPRLPEVREIKSVNLGPDRDSPRLRLQRSHRFNQMQIRSDAPLPEAAVAKLKAEGWTDRTEQEGIWTRQLPPRPRPDAPENAEPAKPAWPVVVDAERVFHDIANSIRGDNGLPPVELERGSVAAGGR